MEPLASLKLRKISGARRLTKNSKLYKTILAAIKEKKGENIITLDLRNITEAVSDFFVICEAGSQPQVRAIAENVIERVREETGEPVFHKEGFDHLQWVLLDYVNIVVHVMLPGTRKFYNLEEMWNDAQADTNQD